MQLKKSVKVDKKIVRNPSNGKLPKFPNNAAFGNDSDRASTVASKSKLLPIEEIMFGEDYAKYKSTTMELSVGEKRRLNDKMNDYFEKNHLKESEKAEKNLRKNSFHNRQKAARNKNTSYLIAFIAYALQNKDYPREKVNLKCWFCEEDYSTYKAFRSHFDELHENMKSPEEHIPAKFREKFVQHNNANALKNNGIVINPLNFIKENYAEYASEVRSLYAYMKNDKGSNSVDIVVHQPMPQTMEMSSNVTNSEMNYAAVPQNTCNNVFVAAFDTLSDTNSHYTNVDDIGFNLQDPEESVTPNYTIMSNVQQNYISAPETYQAVANIPSATYQNNYQQSEAFEHGSVLNHVENYVMQAVVTDGTNFAKTTDSQIYSMPPSQQSYAVQSNADYAAQSNAATYPFTSIGNPNYVDSVSEILHNVDILTENKQMTDTIEQENDKAFATQEELKPFLVISSKNKESITYAPMAPIQAIDCKEIKEISTMSTAMIETNDFMQTIMTADSDIPVQILTANADEVKAFSKEASVEKDVAESVENSSNSSDSESSGDDSSDDEEDAESVVEKPTEQDVAKNVEEKSEQEEVAANVAENNVKCAENDAEAEKAEEEAVEESEEAEAEVDDEEDEEEEEEAAENVDAKNEPKSEAEAEDADDSDDDMETHFGLDNTIHKTKSNDVSIAGTLAATHNRVYSNKKNERKRKLPSSLSTSEQKSASFGKTEQNGSVFIAGSEYLDEAISDFDHLDKKSEQKLFFNEPVRNKIKSIECVVALDKNDASQTKSYSLNEVRDMMDETLNFIIKNRTYANEKCIKAFDHTLTQLSKNQIMISSSIRSKYREFCLLSTTQDYTKNVFAGPFSTYKNRRTNMAEFSSMKNYLNFERFIICIEYSILAKCELSPYNRLTSASLMSPLKALMLLNLPPKCVKMRFTSKSTSFYNTVFCRYIAQITKLLLKKCYPKKSLNDKHYYEIADDAETMHPGYRKFDEEHSGKNYVFSTPAIIHFETAIKNIFFTEIVNRRNENIKSIDQFVSMLNDGDPEFLGLMEFTMSTRNAKDIKRDIVYDFVRAVGVILLEYYEHLENDVFPNLDVLPEKIKIDQEHFITMLLSKLHYFRFPEIARHCIETPVLQSIPDDTIIEVFHGALDKDKEKEQLKQHNTPIFEARADQTEWYDIIKKFPCYPLLNAVSRKEFEHIKKMKEIREEKRNNSSDASKKRAEKRKLAATKDDMFGDYDDSESVQEEQVQKKAKKSVKPKEIKVETKKAKKEPKVVKAKEPKDKVVKKTAANPKVVKKVAKVTKVQKKVKKEEESEE